MIELFRYIEQSFVRPATKDNSVNVEGDSDFQNELRILRNQPLSREKIRKEAQEFINANFSDSQQGSVRLGEQLLEFHHDVLRLKSSDSADINQLVEKIFGTTAQELVQSDDFSFSDDKKFLNDSIIAVKLTTAYDKVNASSLVAMRQAIEFLIQVAECNLPEDINSEQVRKLLLKSMYIPSSLFPPKTSPKQPDDNVNDEEINQRKKIDKLKKEAGELKTTYEALMAVHADELEVVPLTDTIGLSKMESTRVIDKNEELNGEEPSASAIRTVLTLSSSVLGKLDETVIKTIEKADIDVRTTSLPRLVDTIKEKWIKVSRELEPYLAPPVAKVYQLGIHTFAVQPSPPMKLMEMAMPDFSHAVTRPVGIGNLQVVRQELIGYEPGEISHIENVLEGELYRRTTTRSELSELTVTEEKETIQSEERDLQSTERNEMATEAQKEASKQTVATQGQTTSTDYGKLVENSKTNYARSVTDRAVNSLTQKVKEQRIKREQRSFTEKTLHQFDNTDGTTKVRGIYQWVDKKYKTRIMNYGERLLYDVVLPEPAAFLIESLKKAQQPEAFQLIKPSEPSLYPYWLDAGNYSVYATWYGVAGAVEPPPDEFIETFAHTDVQDVSKKIESFGGTVSGTYYSAFSSIKVPNGYKAVSGYIQRTNYRFIHSNPTREFEIYIGEYHFFRFGVGAITSLNVSFKMNEETGDVPVTFCTFENVIQFNYAIGINCKRTDKAYEKWQLKTFAAIMEGYRRQLAEYEDKLAQRQALVRTQMMLAKNYARNPSIEITELKRSFIHLLVSEHLSSVGYPTPPNNQFFFLTDPNYVKKWGAVVAFFERAFEWENIMYTYYPYFYGSIARWGELILIQDLNPEFEEFLKAGATRLVVPVRPGFEAALAHYHETGDVWMGEEMPDMFSDMYVSIIDEIKARNYAPGEEKCVAEWEVKLPTTLVMLREDATLPEWESKVKCDPVEE